MSAMLLMRSEPPVHTLADDLESFLHVLSWVALRFIPHNLGPKALTDLLVVMFDHCYEGEDGFALGGIAKRNYLIGGEVLNSGFRHPILPTLLKDLTATCAVRYKDHPSDEDLAEFHKMCLEQPQMLEVGFVRNSAVAQYERRMAALETSDWMLATLAKALANYNTWPLHDKSVANPLFRRVPRGRKRKSDDGDIMPELPQQRMRFSLPIPEDGEGE